MAQECDEKYRVLWLRIVGWIPLPRRGMEYCLLLLVMTSTPQDKVVCLVSALKKPNAEDVIHSFPASNYLTSMIVMLWILHPSQPEEMLWVLEPWAGSCLIVLINVRRSASDWAGIVRM
jgi:hypothetical protein